MEHFLSTTDTSNITNRTTVTSNQEELPHIAYLVHLAVACILLITTIVSVFTNGAVLFVLFVRNRSFLNRINSYIGVVCLLSLVIALLGCPMVIASSFAGYWLFGHYGCIYYGLLFAFCGISTIFLLTIISVDRFVSNVYNWFNGHSINFFGVSSVCGCLFFSAILSIFPLVGWNKYAKEGLGTSCAPDIEDRDIVSRSYIITLLVFCFLLPLFVMVYCYWRIYAQVKKIRKNLFTTISMDNKDAPKSMTPKKNVDIELRLEKTAISIVGAFLFCWAPYAIILIWTVFDTTPIHPLVSSIPSIITKTGSCFTPLVYIGRDEKVRKAVIDILLCKKAEKINTSQKYEK